MKSGTYPPCTLFDLNEIIYLGKTKIIGDDVLMGNKIMFEIEKYGMFNTVLQANPGTFIKSYCNMLLEMTFPEDEEKIKILLPRILSWYDEGKLDDLLSEQYCWSKDQHIKTHKLLADFIKELNIEYVKPPKKVKRKREFFSDHNPFDTDDAFDIPLKFN